MSGAVGVAEPHQVVVELAHVLTGQRPRRGPASPARGRTAALPGNRYPVWYSACPCLITCRATAARSASRRPPGHRVGPGVARASRSPASSPPGPAGSPPTSPASPVRRIRAPTRGWRGARTCPPASPTPLPPRPRPRCSGRPSGCGCALRAPSMPGRRVLRPVPRPLETVSPTSCHPHASSEPVGCTALAGADRGGDGRRRRTGNPDVVLGGSSPGLGGGIRPVRHSVGPHAPGEFPPGAQRLLHQGRGADMSLIALLERRGSEQVTGVGKNLLAGQLGRLELGAADSELLRVALGEASAAAGVGEVRHLVGAHAVRVADRRGACRRCGRCAAWTGGGRAAAAGRRRQGQGGNGEDGGGSRG